MKNMGCPKCGTVMEKQPNGTFVCTDDKKCGHVLKTIPRPEVAPTEFTKEVFVKYVNDMISRKTQDRLCRHRKVVIEMGYWENPKVGFKEEDDGETLRILFSEYALYDMSEEEKAEIMERL